MKVKYLIPAMTLVITSLLSAYTSPSKESGLLIASTFVGGSSYDDDYGPSMQRDNDGNIYLCGYTGSSDFPMNSGYDTSYNGGKDIFVAKFNSDLTVLLASTFIGGSGNETEATMIFDQDKENLYIAGYTTSANFPTTAGAYDRSVNGGSDVYVVKLDKNLQTIKAATYLGGTSNEGQQWAKLDITSGSNGNIYLAGLTCSADFPVTAGAPDSSYAGGYLGGDAFVAVFNNNLSVLQSATFLGGASDEWRMSIALDSQENIFVSGETESSDFQFTENSYNSGFNGGSDIFICKYNSDLNQLLAATSFGRANFEEPLDLKINASDDVYIAGYSKSGNFPITPGAFDTQFDFGGRDAYIACFSNNLSELKASTLLGGSGRDDITALCVSVNGSIAVTGNTTSVDFPFSHTTYDSLFHGGNEYGDAYLAVLSADLKQLYSATSLGGELDDRGLDILQGVDSTIYLAGYSKSADFPFTPVAYDTINNSGIGDCFVTRFSADFTGNGVGIVHDEDFSAIRNQVLNNYPNPFNPQTTINYTIKDGFIGLIKLKIYNTKGEVVQTFTSKAAESGHFSQIFNGSKLSSGIYYYGIEAGDFKQMKKMVMIK